MWKKYLFIIFIIVLLSVFDLKTQSINKVNVIEKVQRSVVRIYTFENPYFAFIKDVNQGTGYVVSNDGLIVTNAHLIEDVKGIFFYSDDLKNEKPYYAVPVWIDSTLDIAILKSFDCDLPALNICDPSKVKIGDELLVFGYPLIGANDKDIKVTWGIISSDPDDSTLQTTASINPGNSGGPAVNLNGEVVGTVYSKVVSISIESVGFLRNNKYILNAIDSAKTKIDQIKNYFGTEKIEAYKNVCNTVHTSLDLQDSASIDDRRKHVDQSIELLLKALEIDTNYVNAQYFKTIYYLNDALLYCELEDYENADARANKILEEYKRYLNVKKNELKKTKFKNDKYEEEVLDDEEFDKEFEDQYLKEKNNIEYIIDDMIDEDEVECYQWLELADYIKHSHLEREKRYEDFANYINFGMFPKTLKGYLSGNKDYGFEWSGRQRYRGLIENVSVGAFFNTNPIISNNVKHFPDILYNYFNLEVEYVKKLHILLDFYISTIRDSSTTNSSLEGFSSNEGIIPLLGLAYNGFALKYSFSEIKGILVPKWCLSYGNAIPSYGNGYSSYHYFLELSQFEDQGGQFSANIDFRVYKSLWIRTGLNLTIINQGSLIMPVLGLGTRF